MWEELWSNPAMLLAFLIFIGAISRPLIKFIDVWRVQERQLTPDDKVEGQLPIVFEGLGSRLLIYPGVDWGLLVIEHYGLWRRWHGAVGRQKMKLTLASRLMRPWWFLPGMLCLERAKDQGRLGNLGEVQAIYFTRNQEEEFMKADKLIHQINTRYEKKLPVKVEVIDGEITLQPGAASEDITNGITA
jgi:hypothetical protein